MRTTRPRSRSAHGRARTETAPSRPASRWAFTLYVTDDTPRSRNARQNLIDLCEARCPGRYTIDVVDLLRAPERAQADGIVAVPTVIRCAPEPRRTVIGDLTDLACATAGLEFCLA